MEDKLLKPYKGFSIEKSWKIALDGTMKKDSIIYTAYDDNGDTYDADKSIAGIKRKIDIHVG